VAEGGGLLNRYTLSRRIEGSNPSGSASHKKFSAMTRSEELRVESKPRSRRGLRNPIFESLPATQGPSPACLTNAIRAGPDLLAR
jgi:hypothetical protein